ncbi:hypothetical protein OJ967_21400 [Peribacillus frigoritolerans]|uniref:hypothetical protein n=1 Tax=Peribacillus frigoritolerans TaxID=450367 RepID=UPI002225E875|nr:hypothetical protein [Peribacillus frigoritolerans]UYY97941.1 hypothetical protein OJ967_21400 [Peribacillus frigoritolerans]
MTQCSLQPDILTNGAITRILENNWRNEGFIKNEDLKHIHKALIDNNIFGEVAERIYVPVEENKVEMGDKLIKGIMAASEPVPENKTKHVHLFQHKGIVLNDGIYGAGFGRFQYIYRCKGMRIHWFESGLIKSHNIYSTIDENGFMYQTQELDRWDIFGENEIVDISSSPLEEAFGNGEVLIANLVQIKENFSRDYPIEYLLHPPDVEKLSAFSIQICEQIWDAIMNLMKELAFDFDNDKTELLTYLTEFMESQNIPPAAYHVISLFDFYRENQSRIDKDEFLKFMSIIRKHSGPENPSVTIIDANSLFQELEDISPGKEGATAYHDLIFRSLTQIFENSLKRGKKEVAMHEGRKRVDIVFDNHDTNGFFAHIRDRNDIFCPKIFIECKNYSSDPSNPEVDQLIGRLGNLAGKFGILICREVMNEDVLMKRCRDAMIKNQDYIIWLEDKDIKALLKLKETLNEEGIIDYLSTKWDRLILDN